MWETFNNFPTIIITSVISEQPVLVPGMGCSCIPCIYDRVCGDSDFPVSDDELLIKQWDSVNVQCKG